MINENQFQEFVLNQMNLKNQTPNLNSFIDYLNLSIEDSSKVDENYEHRLKQIFSLQFLKDFLIDDRCNEILIYSHTDLHQEIDGKLIHHQLKDLMETDYQWCMEHLAQQNDVTWNMATPFCSFYANIFNRKTRVSLAHYSLNPRSYSKVSIRILRPDHFSFTDFSKENYPFENWIHCKKNILVAGSTGSGKTSLLNTFIKNIDPNENIIILEDTHEIQSELFSRTNFLADEFRDKASLKDLFTHSLRMRPDRIILGEMRSREVIPYVLSLNSGHRGILSTIHANSAKDALLRVAMLFSLWNEKEGVSFETILKMVCQSIDLVIYMENKKIVEVIEVFGSDRGIVLCDTVNSLP